MRLRIGYIIENDRGKKGVITSLDFKNNQRVLGFEGFDCGWCYKEQITKMWKPDGTLVYPESEKVKA